MKPYNRTTITIPTQIYKKMKVRAAYENKNVSSFITDLLRDALSGKRRKKQQLPFGKYAFDGKKILRREDIYESYLRGKVSR